MSRVMLSPWTSEGLKLAWGEHEPRKGGCSACPAHPEVIREVSGEFLCDDCACVCVECAERPAVATTRELYHGGPFAVCFECLMRFCGKVGEW